MNGDHLDESPKPIVDAEQYEKIVSAVKAHFASGKDLLEYEELSRLGDAIQCSEAEVASTVTLMSFGASPILKPEFYRLRNGQRINVPADEVLALIGLPESNPPVWQSSAKQIFIAWRLA